MKKLKELNDAKQKIEKKVIDEQTEILKLVMFYEKKIPTISKDCMSVIYGYLNVNEVFKLRQINKFYKSKIDSGKILD